MAVREISKAKYATDLKHTHTHTHTHTQPFMTHHSNLINLMLYKSNIDVFRNLGKPMRDVICIASR